MKTNTLAYRNALLWACCVVLVLGAWLLVPPPVNGQFWTRIDVDNPAREGIFGQRIEILDDLMLVSWRGDNTLGAYAGAILVYEISDSGIQYRERVIGSNVESGDQFGNDFVVSGNDLLVEEDQGKDVYHFRRDGMGLTEVGRLPMPEIPGYIYETLRMALDGDWAFVSVRVQTITFPRNHYSATVLVFKRIEDNWAFHSRIDPPGFPDEHPWFGVGLAIKGTHAVIYDASDANSPGTGLGAQTFELIDDVWDWRSPLSPSGVGGREIAFTSDNEIKGRAGNTTYWFQLVGDSWMETRHMQFLTTDVYERRWFWLNEFDEWLFLTREISSVQFDWEYFVDVFKKGEGVTEWEYSASFESPEPIETGDTFGLEIALTDRFIIVGAPNRDLDLRSQGGDLLDEVGAIYVALKESFVPGALNTSDLEDVPSDSDFAPAYPNPTAGDATVNYHVTGRSLVTISIYDARGRLLDQALSTIRDPGSYSQKLELASIPSGVYFYRVSIGEASIVRPLTVVH